MSGGVDSTAAAVLLQRDGWAVSGAFLAQPGSMAAEADAREAAEGLGMEFHVFDAGGEFDDLMEYFGREYAHGRTPNPCVRCNRRLKFGMLADRALRDGYDAFATGHHARIVSHLGRPAIARAACAAKDQSYALCMIRPEVLGKLLFPVGTLADKAEARRFCREAGLAVHNRPESQDVCFIPDDDYVAFLRARCPEALQPGRIIDSQGQPLGSHDGYAQFTLGQRRGLGVAAGVPLYVTAIDPQSADVTVGPREQTLSDGLMAESTVWHVPPEKEEFSATVQVRYHHRAQPARVAVLAGDRFAVQFERPVHAVTPGQAAVVYDDEILLGGGWIASPQTQGMP